MCTRRDNKRDNEESGIGSAGKRNKLIGWRNKLKTWKSPITQNNQSFLNVKIMDWKPSKGN